jgi:hypothetical protein
MDINGADFSPDAHFVIVIDVTHSVPHEMGSATMIYDQGLLRGIEIVDALTSATTTPGDLHAAAIAWCKEHGVSTNHFERQAAAHGPSRALHNQLAFCMIHGLRLEFRVRLVGLQGATHLNGRAGVIRNTCINPTNRFSVRLDADDKEVSVKAENVEYVRGDNYRRRAP